MIEDIDTSFNITDTWTFYDVQDRCRDRFDDQDMIIDFETGIKVLRLMEMNYDASVGYNWDEVDFYYDIVTRSRFEKR